MNKDVLQAKSEIVSEIVDKAKSNKSIVVVSYTGLSVAEMTNLRRTLKAEGSSMSIYKNSLVERAADELGYADLKSLLSGPNALIFGQEETSGFKAISKYARLNPETFAIKGAIIEGQFVDADTVKDLSKVGGREGLLSMFLSVLNAPIVQFACAVKAVADAK